MIDIVERLQRITHLCGPLMSGEIALSASDEITRLRADLAAVTAERDRMRALLVCLYDAAGPLDADKMPADDFAQIITIVLDARAALEGVTEPASPWLDIESAPKDGNSIEVWDESPGAVNPAVVFWENGVWVYADDLLADAAPDGALPSHWRPRSEPPR